MKFYRNVQSEVILVKTKFYSLNNCVPVYIILSFHSILDFSDQNSNVSIQMSQLNVSSCGGSNSEKSTSEKSDIFLFEPSVHNFEFAPIENHDIVELSAVENEKTLWIRAIKYDEKYCEFLSKINSANVNDPVLQLQYETVVLVKYSGDYSRGIVLDKDKMCIQLMDIGAKIEANLSKYRSK